MKIGPYEIGKIGAEVLCAGKIGREVLMSNEPKPCKCGKTPDVFKVFSEWEVCCEDECVLVQNESREHAIEIWNERMSRPAAQPAQKQGEDRG